MATIRFNFREAFGPQAMQARKDRMVAVLLDQTKRRLMDGADEDGPLPPLDFPRLDGSTNNPLNRTGANILNTLTHAVTANSFWVGSRFIGARVHQYGTVGKGGLLPSIRPVRAKALFIPMSHRGAKSDIFNTPDATPEHPRRMVKVKRGGLIRFQQLKQGKDFMLLQKVDIRPRRFLKLTGAGRRELIQAGFGGGK